MLYALGEIILVMIGILLALQVNNWNENRKDRKLEKVLLREINEEFKSNLTEFEGTLGRYEGVLHNLTFIIQSFPIDLQKIDLDSLAQAFEHIHFRGNVDRSVNAMSKLKNSGSFDLISNPELQSLLIEWEVMDADYLYDEHRSLLFHQEQFAPMMYTRFSRPYSVGLRDKRVDLNYLRTLEFEGMMKLKFINVNNLFRAMKTEPNLKTVMRRIIELSEID